MADSRIAFIDCVRRRPVRLGSALLAAACFVSTAQAQQAPTRPDARIVVTGQGSIGVAPDYAQFTGGVTTRAKTVKEAADSNSRTMAGVMAALAQLQVPQKDIQTSRLSIQPVYAPAQPNSEPKLSGYSVSNQLTVIIRQVGKLGDVLDQLISAGVTDIGNVAFLVADPSKALDQAREAAIADARRKADVYARAAGLRLGEVQWITEDTEAGPVPLRLQRATAPAAVPIATGEDTLRVKVTVGFDIAH